MDPDGMAPDAPVPDGATPDAPEADAAVPDAANPDAGAIDAAACNARPDAGGNLIFCGCGASGVCGTGVIGDPFRCCNVAEDSCNKSGRIAGSYDPCTPKRCSIEPTCCILYLEPCASDTDCGGRPGSCDLDILLCTTPCDPSVNDSCGTASYTCQRTSGSPLADGTPCDDGACCSTASPPPVLADCVGTDGTTAGPNCTKDLRPGGGGPTACPATAPVCSGTGSTLVDSGGAVVDGRCCPNGTACDLDPASATYLKCLGNFGKGTFSNDVCRAGVCSSDDSSTCPP
jgi:hypothetical protein